MLKSYDRAVRPGGNEAVTVDMSMFIMHMGWEKNKLCLTAFVRQGWTDSRLTSPEAGKPLVVSADEIRSKIWEPDTFVPEAIERETLETGFVRIDGHKLFTSQMWKLKVPCRGSIGELYASNGHMTCSFTFESYPAMENELKYEWQGPKDQKPVDWKKTMDSGINITNIATEQSSVTRLLGKYSNLKVTVDFQTPFRKDVFDYLSSESIQKIA